MADNVPITAGSGTSIATDDVSGQHFQKVKLAYGQADTATTVDGTTAGSLHALTCVIVDSSGTVVDSFGGSGSGTEYTEDAAAAANPVGGQLMLRRRDSLTSETTTDGDVTAGNCTAKGELYVKHVDDVTVSNTSFAVTNAGTFAVQIGANSSVNVNQIGGTAVDANSGNKSAGTQRVVLATDQPQLTNALKIDGSAVTQPVSNAGTFAVQAVCTNAGTFATQAVCTNAGTFAVQATLAAGATTIAKAEDVASADADVGVPSMAVRKASPANTSGNDGDYEFLQMSAGRLWVDASGVTLTVGSHAVTNVGTFVVQENGAALTSLQLIDDGIATTGSAITAKGMAAAGTDGTNARILKTDSSGELQVDVLTLPALPAGSNSIGTVVPAGNVAHDAADSGNPVKVGGKAANAFPTAVANADRADFLTDLFGRQLVSHIDPAQQVWKSANYTSGQTGTAIWTPASGKKIAITHLIVGTYGTTAARLILWFGASGDTTYSAGTDQLVLAASYAPSSTSKPGTVVPLPFPMFAATADHILRITTDAALSVDVTVYGYEF